MGKMDVAVHQLLERTAVFADLINGTIYEGEQVVKPEDLTPLFEQSGMLKEENGKTAAVERRRDIQMRADLVTYSVILAIEAQDSVHHAMPIRSMLYDALEYTRQAQELERKHLEDKEELRGDAFLSGIKKEDRLVPVITTVLYFGRKEWSGSRSLYEMLDFDETDPNVQKLKEYLPDYKINLVHAGNMEEPKRFRTCLQQIFSMLKYNQDKEKLYQYVQQERAALDRMDRVELMATMILLGEQKRLAKMIMERGEKEEEITMCSAIDDLIKDGEDRGRTIGKAQSILEILEDLGAVPEDLKHQILEQQDLEQLRIWLKAAAKAKSVEDFHSKIS